MTAAGVLKKLADAGLGKTFDQIVKEGGGPFTFVGAIGGLFGGSAAGVAVATPVVVTPAAPVAPAIVVLGGAGGAFVGARVGRAIDALLFDDADLEKALKIAFEPID